MDRGSGRGREKALDYDAGSGSTVVDKDEMKTRAGAERLVKGSGGVP